AGLRQCGAAPGQPAREQRQVAPVGIERVAREALFEPEAVDEGRQRGVLAIGRRRAHQSSLSFWRATTSLQTASSALIWAPNSAGELPTTSEPVSSTRLRTAGSLSASMAAALIFATMSAGRPLGPSRP